MMTSHQLQVSIKDVRPRTGYTNESMRSRAFFFFFNFTSIKPLENGDEHKERPMWYREKWHLISNKVLVEPQGSQIHGAHHLRGSLQCSVEGHVFSNDKKGNVVPPNLHMLLFFPWSENISLLIHPPLFSLEKLRGLEQ